MEGERERGEKGEEGEERERGRGANQGQKLGVQLVPFLPQVIPAFLALMHREPKLQEAVIVQLARIFSAIGIYSREYVEDALKVVKEFSGNPNLTKPILTLLEGLYPIFFFLTII
jgi:hypothetical protein